jgi:ABC-2 type transport system permease protein
LHYLRLIWLFLRISIQGDAAYRFDFLLRIATSLMQLGGELIMLWIIFFNTTSLAGWDVYQILVLLGVFRFMAGIIGILVAPNMRRIMEDVRQGTLDFVLTKPINSQFYVSFRQIVIWRTADLVLGLSLAMVGALRLHVHRAANGLLIFDIAPQASFGATLAFVLLIAGAATIIYSFWLVLATTTFWFTRIENIEMVFWNVFEAARYPVQIYGTWVRRILTYVIPLGFLTTTPAAALVGKADPWTVTAASMAAVVSLAAATWFWRFGLRHYSGASA